MAELPYDKIAKYLKGNITLVEKEEIEEWIQSDPVNKRAFNSLRTVWTHSDKRYKVDDVATEAHWKELEKRLASESRLGPIVRKLHRTLSSQTFRRTYYVAASLLFVVLCYRVLFPADEAEKVKTLGLPRIVDQEEVLETVLAAKGGVEFFYLPDSSKVWLDDSSTLTYTQAFNESERMVNLKGKAFFDVKRDTTKTFIIHARNTNIKVLGTSFNVSAEPHKSTVEVTVVSGKVSFNVEEENKRSSISLVADEKGVFYVDELVLNKLENDDPEFLDWKDKEEEVELEKVKTEKKVKPKQPIEEPVAEKEEEAFDLISTVRHDYRWKKNFINQTVVRGYVANRSDSIIYDRLIFKISCENRVQGKEYIRRFPIQGPLAPGETISYKKTFLIDWLSNTTNVEIEVENIREVK